MQYHAPPPPSLHAPPPTNELRRRHIAPGTSDWPGGETREHVTCCFFTRGSLSLNDQRWESPEKSGSCGIASVHTAPLVALWLMSPGWRLAQRFQACRRACPPPHATCRALTQLTKSTLPSTWYLRLAVKPTSIRALPLPPRIHQAQPFFSCNMPALTTHRVDATQHLVPQVGGQAHVQAPAASVVEDVGRLILELEVGIKHLAAGVKETGDKQGQVR